MKICYICLKRNKDEAEFCKSCGEPLSVSTAEAIKRTKLYYRLKKLLVIAVCAALIALLIAANQSTQSGALFTALLLVAVSVALFLYIQKLRTTLKKKVFDERDWNEIQALRNKTQPFTAGRYQTGNGGSGARQWQNPPHNEAANGQRFDHHTSRGSESSSDIYSLESEKKKSIDEKIAFLWKELNAPPFEEYSVSAAIKNRLSRYVNDSGKDASVVKELVGEILSHVGMVKQWVDVEVIFREDVIPSPEAKLNKPTGTYNETGFLYGKVIISVEPQYDANAIIAICCHECAHHLLRKRRIKLDDLIENERLTDLAAVYMGFGLYMQLAYEEKQVSAGVRTKLGYLSAREISYAYFEIIKQQIGEELKQDRLNDMKADINGRIIKLKAEVSKNKTNMSRITNFDIAHNSEGSLKLMFENYQSIMSGEMEGWERQFSARVDGAKVSYNDLLLTQNEIEDYRARILEYNNAVEKFITLSQYQSNLSDEALVSLKTQHRDALRCNASAIMMLIRYYLSIPGFPDDAEHYFMKLFDCKDAEGFLYLGDCYSNGIIAEKNIETAKYYYYNAMALGSSTAKERFEEMEKDANKDVGVIYAK